MKKEKKNTNKDTNNIKKNKFKLNKKNIIILIISLILITTLTISIINIIKWNIDNVNLDQEIKEVESEVNEVEDNENTVVIEPKKVKKDDPYFDFIKMKLINVDLTELKKINSDTVGWINVSGTNINYPFVQTTDNSYYLTHSFYKKPNDAGWVFLDYRNNIDNLDKNNIIYAHGRVNKTMFGSLKNILNSGWLNNTNNYVVKLSTEKNNTLWQVFSVYKIPTTNDYIQVKFSSNSKFEEFANMLISRSQFDFNTTVSGEDKILTLSTCYNDSEKVVLHAKLIKKEAK